MPRPLLAMHSDRQVMTVRLVPFLLLCLLLVGCGNVSPPADSVGQTRTPSGSTTDLLAGLDLKTASDVQKRFEQVVPNAGIEIRARAIAEVDEWLFAPDAGESAQRLIDNQIGLLRDQIGRQVAALTKAAVEAPNGTIATEKLAQINRLLQLYPVPTNEGQQAQLARIISAIQATGRRVEDIRRLRYNTWAVAQIEVGLAKYRETKGWISTDDEALMVACANSLKEVDPNFLEPAALDLYNYLLGLTRDALSQQFKIALAKWLSNPETVRKTPRDF